MNEQTKNTNTFRYENGKITLSGVLNVNAFDEKEVVLRLTNSILTIHGNGFKMEEMETKSGLFSMNGTISSLSYHDKGEKTSFIKRLLK